MAMQQSNSRFHRCLMQVQALNKPYGYESRVTSTDNNKSWENSQAAVIVCSK